MKSWGIIVLLVCRNAVNWCIPHKWWVLRLEIMSTYFSKNVLFSVPVSLLLGMLRFVFCYDFSRSSVLIFFAFCVTVISKIVYRILKRVASHGLGFACVCVASRIKMLKVYLKISWMNSCYVRESSECMYVYIKYIFIPALK